MRRITRAVALLVLAVALAVGSTVTASADPAPTALPAITVTVASRTPVTLHWPEGAGSSITPTLSEGGLRTALPTVTADGEGSLTVDLLVQGNAELELEATNGARASAPIVGRYTATYRRVSVTEARHPGTMSVWIDVAIHDVAAKASVPGVGLPLDAAWIDATGARHQLGSATTDETGRARWTGAVPPYQGQLKVEWTMQPRPWRNGTAILYPASSFVFVDRAARQTAFTTSTTSTNYGRQFSLDARYVWADDAMTPAAGTRWALYHRPEGIMAGYWRLVTAGNADSQGRISVRRTADTTGRWAFVAGLTSDDWVESTPEGDAGRRVVVKREVEIKGFVLDRTSATFESSPGGRYTLRWKGGASIPTLNGIDEQICLDQGKGWNCQTGRTDRKGHGSFGLPSLTRHTRVQLRVPQQTIGQTVVPATSTTLTVKVKAVVTVGAASSVRSGRKLTISGRTHRAAGQRVEILLDGRKVAATTSGRDGRYRVTITPKKTGKRTIQARVPGSSSLIGASSAKHTVWVER